jgi:hypothetical protein
MAGPAGGGFPAFDTGWKKNCITYVGILSILDRFVSEPANATILSGSYVAHADAIKQPLYIAVGTGTSADYFLDDELNSEIAYNAGGRPAISDTRIIAGPNGSGAKTLARSAIVSAPVVAEQLCALSATVTITELGLCTNPETEGSDFYAGTTFAGITVSGAQAFTIFYSISLTQAA